MQVLLIIAAIAAATENPVAYRVIDYDPDNMRAWYHSPNAFNSATNHSWDVKRSYNGTRNANLRNEWQRPAGTLGMQRVGARRQLKIPVGGKRIVAFRRNGKWHWMYPEGSIVSEKLYDQNHELFAERSREKIDGRWETIQDDLHFEPVGFKQRTKECRECHDQAGKGVAESSQYRDHLRGSDGVFSAQPITIGGRVDHRFKDLVEVR